MDVKSVFQQVKKINAELKCRRPYVDWGEWVMGEKEEEECSAIVQRDTRSDTLRRRHEDSTNDFGDYH